MEQLVSTEEGNDGMECVHTLLPTARWLWASLDEHENDALGLLKSVKSVLELCNTSVTYRQLLGLALIETVPDEMKDLDILGELGVAFEGLPLPEGTSVPRPILLPTRER